MERWIAMLLAAPMLFSCAMAETGGLDLNREVKPATAFTAQANAAVYDELDFSDKQSGKLTMNVGLLKTDEEKITLGIDIRYPVTLKADEIKKRIKETFESQGFAAEITEHMDPVFMDENGEVIRTLIGAFREVTGIEDEPTGGTHLSLVLAGNYHVSFAEAEAIKQDYARHKEILPVVRPVIEKMATIVKKYVNPAEIDTIYLCGGTTCLTGIEGIFEKVTGIRTIKPANPFLVTPAGIAKNCILSER